MIKTKEKKQLCVLTSIVSNHDIHPGKPSFDLFNTSFVILLAVSVDVIGHKALSMASGDVTAVGLCRNSVCATQSRQ